MGFVSVVLISFCVGLFADLQRTDLDKGHFVRQCVSHFNGTDPASRNVSEFLATFPNSLALSTQDSLSIIESILATDPDPSITDTPPHESESESESGLSPVSDTTPSPAENSLSSVLTPNVILAIVGIFVGCIILLCAICCCCVCLAKRYRNCRLFGESIFLCL